jgi:hypothetical protein
MNEVLVKTFSSSAQTIFATVFIGIMSVLVSGIVSAKDSTNNSDTTHIDRTNSNNATQTFNQKLSLQDVLAASVCLISKALVKSIVNIVFANKLKGIEDFIVLRLCIRNHTRLSC